MPGARRESRPSGREGTRPNRKGDQGRADSALLGRMAALQENRAFFWIALAAILALGAFLRIHHLGADPPLRLDWSQAPVTDGANVVEPARNKIIFGSWTPDPRNPALAHYPLSALAAYVSFRLAGVGLPQAAIPSVVAGILSILLVARLLVGRAGRFPAFLAALFLATNYQIIMFDRLPMSESMMIFLMVASASVLVEGISAEKPRWLILAAAGALVGLDGFFVKLHALLLLPVGLLAILGMRPGTKQETRRALAAYAGGTILLGLVWFVAVVLPHFSAMSRFLEANVLGHYTYKAGGGGEILHSVASFLRKRTQGLFAFGVNVTFLWRTLPAAALGLILLIRYLYRLPRSFRESPPLPSVLTLWLGLGILALSLLDYRPLRYHVMLIPPLTMLAALGLYELLGGSQRWRLPPLRGRLLLLLPAAGFFIGYQCVGEGGRMMVFHSQAIYDFLTALGLDGDRLMNSVGSLTQGFAHPTFTALAIGLVVVLLYAAAQRRLTARGGLPLSALRRESLVLLVVLLAVAVDMGHYLAWTRHVRYTLRETGRDLGEILSPGAMLLGSAATTLCLENGFATIPHFGDLTRREEPSVLTSYPVTHIIYRGPRLRSFVEKNLPGVYASQVFVRSYMVAGEMAELWRVPTWPGLAGRAPYRPSDFEEGIALLQENRFAEAAGFFERFLARVPDNGNACIVLGACYSEMGREEETLALFERAGRLRPNDTAVLQDLGDLYLRMGEEKKAEETWARVLQLEPKNEDLAVRLAQLRTHGREGFTFGEKAGQRASEPAGEVKPPFYEGDER